MILRDSRVVFAIGLGLEAVCIAIAFVVPGPGALAAVLWGALVGASYAFSMNVTLDERGIRGRNGLSRLEVPWPNVAAVLPLPGALRVILRSGEAVLLRVPSGRVEEARAYIERMRDGGTSNARVGDDGVLVRVVDDAVTTNQWRIPAGVETFLALHKSDTQLLCVHVLVGGAKVDDVATAARTLAVRAASEHRWDPSFTGAINLRVSELGTPITPRLRTLMDHAIAGARADLAARGWTAASGTPFSLTWDVMGPSLAPAS